MLISEARMMEMVWPKEHCTPVLDKDGKPVLDPGGEPVYKERPTRRTLIRWRQVGLNRCRFRKVREQKSSWDEAEQENGQLGIGTAQVNKIPGG